MIRVGICDEITQDREKVREIVVSALFPKWCIFTRGFHWKGFILTGNGLSIARSVWKQREFPGRINRRHSRVQMCMTGIVRRKH